MTAAILPQQRKAGMLLFYLALAAGAILRLYRLGYYSLWTDETDSVYAAYYNLDYLPPLFRYGLRWWLPLATNDTLVRLFPALFGILAIYLMWRVARLVGPGAGTSAVLFAFSPVAVYYSREVRMYPLLLAASFLSWERLILLVNRPTRSRILYYALAAALTIHIHHYAFYLLLGQAVLICYRKPYKQWLALGLKTYSLIGLVCLPYLLSILDLLSGLRQSGSWTEPVTLRTVGYTLRFLTSGYEPGAGIYLVLAALTLGLALIAAAYAPGTLCKQLLLCGFGVPVSAALCMGYLSTSSFYVPRYLLFTIGPLLICVAAGLQVISSKAIRRSLLASMLILQTASISYQYRNQIVQHDMIEVRPKKEFRQACGYIASRFKEGDVVGCTCVSGSEPCWYYLSYRRGLPFPRLLDQGGVYKRLVSQKFNIDDYLTKNIPIQVPQDVSAVIPKYTRLWLYATQWNVGVAEDEIYYQIRVQLTRWLAERYLLVDYVRFYGVDLYLFDLTKQAVPAALTPRLVSPP